MNLYCMIFAVAFTASYAEYKYNFIRLCGFDLIAEQMNVPYSTQEEAVDTCISLDSCVGVKKITETEYYPLRTLRNLKPIAGCCDGLPDVYLYNRAFGIVMANSPSDMDVTLLYGIYIYSWSNCPTGFTNIGSMCNGAISAADCNAYPSFMESSYITGNGTCSTVTKETLINQWA
uniref:Uncharacterized protein n=1 Tax=Panagrolaimus davidi TaxID=227884 RepID=A0A914PPG1_9BILA